ncbi:MAG: aldolase/citrate lyase family protein [Casimicrobiaceae bacterium]
MNEIDNPVLRKLEAGMLAVGIGVRIARTVEIARAMHNAGYDWLFLDLEHGTMPLDAIAQIAVVALEVGIAPIVRVPPGEYTMATRALDNGALGIILPHVDTADAAREAVDRLKYPPLGHRSIGGTGAVLGFRPERIAHSMAALNRATLTIVMLETPQAIANAHAIAAVPGVDIVLIGTNDLCAELGIPGTFDAPEIVAAYTQLVAACKAAGKRAGMAGVADEALMRRYIAMGVQFVLAGSDFPLLIAAAAQRCARVRGAGSAG